jgi:hypothetical protein
MSERTGLGVVEVAVLEALETKGFRRCDRAVAEVEERIGLAPGYAYDVLVDLARPWTMPVHLVDGQGNFGSRGDDPPADFRYTEARISPAGRVALAAERGELAPVPIGMINGNTYGQGLRPPFRPRAVTDAIREVIRRPEVTDEELTGLVGLPYFMTRCTVTGDLAALAAGRETDLRLTARISISQDGENAPVKVVIENIPPNISIDDTARIIASLVQARRSKDSHPRLHNVTTLPLADVRNETTERTPFGRLRCIPEPGASVEQLAKMLQDVDGVSMRMPVKLPRPLSALIRGWVRAGAEEDLPASLAALEQAMYG